MRRHTGKDVTPRNWTCKLKLGPSGQVDKGRYVAKGFKQLEVLEYFEIFVLTSEPELFYFLIQLSAKQSNVMHQFDVKTVFLHSPIEEEVYLEQPQEFVKQGLGGGKLLCQVIN